MEKLIDIKITPSQWLMILLIVLFVSLIGGLSTIKSQTKAQVSSHGVANALKLGDFQVQHFYQDNIHYIFVGSKSGNLTIINYTEDSISFAAQYEYRLEKDYPGDSLADLRLYDTVKK